MWFHFNKSKFYDTEFNTISNLLKNYFKSIDVAIKTEYKENFKKIQDYFKKSQNCSKSIRKFNNYFLKTSIQEREKIKEIVNNNLKIENYLIDYESFISYNDLTKNKYEFSKEFVKILINLDTDIWKYLSNKDNGSIKKQYYEMLYNSLDNKICCPFCGINTLKNTKFSGKLSPLEHFIPKSKYPFVAWNTDNIFLSCEECNSKKGSKTLKEKKSNFFPLGFGTNSKIKLKLISYDLIIEEDSSINTDNCKIEFISKNISLCNFNEYLSTWNHLFSIKNRLKESLISHIITEETKFKKKKRSNPNFDFLTDIEVELEEAEKDGNIIKVAYLEYKKNEIENN